MGTFSIEVTLRNLQDPARSRSLSLLVDTGATYTTLPRDVVDHIQVVRYYVGVSEQKAMDQFRRYLKQLDPAT